MASSLGMFCTLCKDDDVDSPASVWCTDCSDFLCLDCERHHQRSRLSKNHRTMKAEDYQQLPASIKDSKSNCEIHDRRFEMYCTFHDCACCIMCIEEVHGKCEGLKELSGVIRNVKSSASMTTLHADLKKLGENYEKISKFAHDQTLSLDEQKGQGLDDIKKMRRALNEHLDKIEKVLVQKLELKHSSMLSKFKELLRKIEEKINIVNDMQEEFAKLNTIATDLQAFNGLRSLEKKTEQEFAFIKSLQDKGEIGKPKLHVKIKQSLSSIQNILSFGDVLDQIVLSNLGIKIKQGVIQTNTVASSRPSLCQAFSIRGYDKNPSEESLVSGCEILPDDVCVFAEQYEKEFRCFDNKGLQLPGIHLINSISPFDVCYVSADMIALSKLNEPKILFWEMKKKTGHKHLDVGKGEKYLGCDGKSLVVGRVPGSYKVKNAEICVFLAYLPFTRIVKIDLNTDHINGIDVIDDIIVYTVSSTNTVNCIDLNGEILWTLQDARNKSPSGIGIDINGYSYIACRDSNAVVKIPPDGKSFEVIITAIDGLFHLLFQSREKKATSRLQHHQQHGIPFSVEVT